MPTAGLPSVKGPKLSPTPCPRRGPTSALAALFWWSMGTPQRAITAPSCRQWETRRTSRIGSLQLLFRDSRLRTAHSQGERGRIDPRGFDEPFARQSEVDPQGRGCGRRLAPICGPPLETRIADGCHRFAIPQSPRHAGVTVENELCFSSGDSRLSHLELSRSNAVVGPETHRAECPSGALVLC